MKKQAIEMGAKLLATDGEKVAADAWEKMKAGLFGGKEPTDDALKLFDADDLKGAGVEPVLAKAWGKLFAGSVAAAEDATFKAKKASRYTPGDLARFYAANADDAALNTEIDSRTMAEWVIAVDGKVNADESAKFLAWNIAGDEPPRAVKVNGVRIAPVRRGMEKATKKHAEDPSAPGHRLPVDGVSKVTGAAFATMTPACRKLYRVALSHELRGANVLVLREYARKLSGDVKVMDFEEVLPDAFEVYTSKALTNTLPALEIEDGALEATRVLRDGAPAPGFLGAGAADGARAGSLSAPLVFVLSGNADSTKKLIRVHCSTLIRTGAMRMEADTDCPPTCDRQSYNRLMVGDAAIVLILVNASNLASDDFMETVAFAYRTNKKIVPVLAGNVSVTNTYFDGKTFLPRNSRVLAGDEEATRFVGELRVLLSQASAPPDPCDIHAAILSAGIARETLLIGIDRRLTAGFPVMNNPSATILSDLHELRRIGGNAWRTWLQNAEQHAGPRVESAVFRRALTAL